MKHDSESPGGCWPSLGTTELSPTVTEYNCQKLSSYLCTYNYSTSTVTTIQWSMPFSMVAAVPLSMIVTVPLEN